MAHSRDRRFDDIRARWIIGADGENSRVGAGPASMPRRSESFRYGFRGTIAFARWTDFMEIYWGPGCQMYVTPVGGGEACVALITRDPHLRMDACDAPLSRTGAEARRSAPSSATSAAPSLSRAV